MAAEGGIFLDILARLNAASVDKVIRDAQKMMQEAADSGGKEFSASLDRSISANAKKAFDPLVEASNAAFRDMQIGLADLQVAEARINDLRVRNYQSTADKIKAIFSQSTRDQMVAAQTQLDAAIANSQRLVAEASTASAAARDGAVVPGPRSQPNQRRPIVPISRAGGVAAAAGGLFLGYGLDQNFQAQRNTQQVYARGNESQADIGSATNWIWQNAGRLGTSPRDLSSAYNQTERLGYRGQDALNLVNTAAEVAKRSGASIEETVKGLDTTLADLGYSTSEHKANLDQINTTASQLTQTLDKMKISGDQATEFFSALHSIEPVLMAIQNAVPGNTTQAQGDAILQVLSQHGITPEQASQNAGHFAMQLAGMRPGSPQYESLAQLGLRPQDIAGQVQTQGIVPALNTIQNQIQSKSFTGPDGQQLIHTGMEFNNDQLNDISKQIYDSLSDAGKAYVDTHESVNSGVASGAALRKDLEKGEVPGADVQSILAYSHDRALLTGLNPKVKKGGEADMTPEEFANWLFGSGDTARTGGILLNNLGDVNKAVSTNQNAGPSNYLGGSFEKYMQGLPGQWDAFTSSLKGLAGEMSQSLLPTMTDFVNGMKDVIDWLQKHKGAEEALVNVIEDIAAAWGASKVINMFEGIAKSLGLLATATDVATGQVSTMGKNAQAAGEEMAGSGIGAALKGAAANLLSVFSTAALASLIGQQVSQAADNWIADHVPGGNTIENNTPSQWGPEARSALSKPTLPPDQWLPGTVPQPGKIPGRAFGGLIPDQPLMGVADTGGDSVLGMLPNGSPVGLRGGEGILTPETVAALGGEEGVNALNANANNPWANPMKVGTTFYNSFAKGVAKYSPWGKYLAAAGQSLDSLEKQTEDANKIQQKDNKGLADFMINFYDNQYAAVGDKYSGPSINSIMKNPGKYWYNPGTGNFQSGAVKGGSPEVMDAIRNAAQSMGLNETQYNDVKWIFSHESGFDPTISNGGGHGAPSNSKAYGLGQFLGHMGDKYGQMGAYSGDPGQETRAAIQYMIDRYGSPQAAKAYWESHGNYSKGGVVKGYAGGGIASADVRIYGTKPGPTPDPGGALTSPGSGAIPNGVPGWWSKVLSGAAGSWAWWMPPYNQQIAPDPNGRSPLEPPTGLWGGPWDNPNGSANGPNPEDPNFWPPGMDPSLPGIAGSKKSGGSSLGYAGGGVVPVLTQSPAPRAPAPPPPPSPGTAGNQGKYPAPGNPHYQISPPKPKAPPKPLTDKPQKNVYGNVPNAYKIPEGTQPVGDRNIKDNPSQQLTAEGKGFSAGGGLLGMAESAAATAANMFAPGSGQAAQPLFDLANRAIGFGGQLVGIGLEGLMETFLPNDSPGADPSKNIFGKMALGIAGAHPGGNNMAGSHAKQLDPKKDLDAGAAQAKQMPGIHISGDIHNHSGDHKETFNAINKAVNFANNSGAFAGK